MQVTRCRPAVVSRNGLLYVLGGQYPEHQRYIYSQKCEVFDPKTNTWSIFSYNQKIPYIDTEVNMDIESGYNHISAVVIGK